jgi:hypothetical protein
MSSRNHALILTRAMLSLALLSIVPAAARAQRAASRVPVSAVPSRPDGLTQAIQDTIAAHLTALELQRPELLASGRAPDHPDLVAVTRRLAALRTQLSELPNPKAAEATVNAALIRAIEAKLAGLTVEHRLRALELPANHPDLQAMAALEAALQQRRSELRMQNR